MTKSISIDAVNCYGIDKMSHSFNFSHENMPIAIYAPNGIMKTSLAKTLHDYMNGRKPKDLYFPERLSSFFIEDENKKPLDPTSIFVIDSINEKYQSDRISTLIANESLKSKYDSIFGSIARKKDQFKSSLKTYFGTKLDIEAEVENAFRVSEGDFLTAIARLEREIKLEKYLNFSQIKYNIINSDRVQELINEDEIKSLISEYTSIYERMLDESIYFKKGVFNHSNAESIAKNLKSNGWFEGGHSVNLRHGELLREITTENDLAEAIDSEKQKILQDPKLSELFQKVDSKFTTVELRKFRDYLIKNPFVVSELNDIDSFKQKLIISYIGENSDSYFELINEFDRSQDEIKTILNEADKERTQWEFVIDQFNSRFSVPFEVRIENKGDAILNEKTPQIAFYVKDNKDISPRKIDRSVLDMGLSTGKKSTLHTQYNI